MAADKQSLDATFYAFRKRDKGGVLLGASLAFAVLCVVLFVAFGFAITLLAGSDLPDQARMVEAMARGDAATMQSLFSPHYLLLVSAGNLLFWPFVFLVLLAAYEAACLRWMIHGEREGLFGFSLGADTWRVYGTYWMWLITWIVGWIALTVLLIILFWALGAAGNVPGLGWLTGLLGVIGVVGLCIILPIHVLVRLAPAAATSVARRKFGFFHAWTTSRGRFWGLFGAFLLLFLLNIVVACAVGGVWFNVMMPADAFNFSVGPKDAEQFAAEYQRFMENYLSAIMTPRNLALFWALQAAGSAISLVFYVLYYGVNARAAALALEEGKFGAPAAEAAA